MNKPKVGERWRTKEQDHKYGHVRDVYEGKVLLFWDVRKAKAYEVFEMSYFLEFFEKCVSPEKGVLP